MSEWNKDIGICPLDTPVLVKSTYGFVHLCQVVCVTEDRRLSFYPLNHTKIHYKVTRESHYLIIDFNNQYDNPPLFDESETLERPVAWMLVDLVKMVKDADAKVGS